MSDNPYQAPQSSLIAHTASERDAGPAGLGGWLIVVGIQLVVTAIVNAMRLTHVHVAFYADGAWWATTSLGGALSDPRTGPVVLYEMIGGTLFALGNAALLAMLFRKAPSFPRWMIVLLAGHVIFLGLDEYLLARLRVMHMDERGNHVRLIAACIAMASWVPYLLVSKRVRNTFTRRLAATPQVETPRDTPAPDEAATP